MRFTPRMAEECFAMARANLGIMFIGVGVLLAGGTAQAGAIDYSRTGGGGATPGSNLVADMPTPWELFSQPMAASAPTGRGYAFSEPGMGNAIGQARGQVLNYRNVGGRTTRVIMDVLAWVPVAQLLYLDPSESSDTGSTLPAASAGFIPVILPRGGAVQDGTNGRLIPPTPTPIPEPASLALVATGAALLLFKRRR